MHDTIWIFILLSDQISVCSTNQSCIDYLGYYTGYKTVLNSNSWLDFRRCTYTQNVNLGLFKYRCCISFMAVDYLISPSQYNLKVKQTSVSNSCTLMQLLICHRIFHMFTDGSFLINRPAQKDVELQSVGTSVVVLETGLKTTFCWCWSCLGLDRICTRSRTLRTREFISRPVKTVTLGSINSFCIVWFI